VSLAVLACALPLAGGPPRGVLGFFSAGLYTCRVSVPPQRVAPTSAAAAPPGGSDDGDTTASQDRVSLTDEEETLLAALPIPPECLAAARRSEPPRPGASALAGVRLPRDVPGTVEIRTMEDDLGDETEVRTQPGMPPMEGERESTTPSGGYLSLKPLVSLGGEARRQQTLPGLAPPTGRGSPDGEPRTVRVVRSEVLDDPYDADDSITTRGPPVDIYEEESVTSRAPPLKAPFPEEDAYDGDDGTEGTTQKVRRRSGLDEADSITARAPGHLTNMLRVIASNDPPRLHDDDEVPENHTALMPNAPPQRPSSNAPPQRPAASAAPQGPVPEGSESRLRAAAAAARAKLASHGPLGLPDLGPANVNMQGDPMASSLSRSMQDASLPHLDIARQAELMRGPRYGLLVGVVAAVCLVVPIALFVALNHAPTAAVPRTASERAPDVVSRDEPARQKATKSAKPLPEAPPPAPPRPSPLRRR
jgi:hypothetical protein